MRALPLLPLLLAGAGAAQDLPGVAVCHAEGREPFEISSEVVASGSLWHCVDGLTWDGQRHCAPQGGWYYVSILCEPGDQCWTTDAREAQRQRLSSMMFAHSGPTLFVASYATSGPPYALEIHGTTTWRLRWDRASGEGAVFTPDGETRFTCAAP